MSETNRIGAAGRHRREDDLQERPGELKIAVGAHKNQVILNFGRSVAWLSMDPVEARNVAMLLLEKASKVDGKDTRITMGA